MRALDQVWIGRINRALADKTWSSEIVKNTQSSVTIRPFPLYFNKICRSLFPIDPPCTSCCVFHASSLCFPGPTFSAFFIISHCIYSPTHSPITRPFLVRFSRGFFSMYFSFNFPTIGRPWSINRSRISPINRPRKFGRLPTLGVICSYFLWPCNLCPMHISCATGRDLAKTCPGCLSDRQFPEKLLFRQVKISQIFLD